MLMAKKDFHTSSEWAGKYHKFPYCFSVFKFFSIFLHPTISFTLGGEVRENINKILRYKMHYYNTLTNKFELRPLNKLNGPQIVL